MTWPELLAESCSFDREKRSGAGAKRERVPVPVLRDY